MSARLLFDAHAQSLDVVKIWADRVPGFSQLCIADQQLLFQSAALELIVLRMAYRCLTSDR